MDKKEMQQFATASMHLSKYFLRVAIFVILFGAILIFVKQDKCLTILKYEINIITKDEGEQFSLPTDEVFEISKIMQCSDVPAILRFDCHPEDGGTEASCTSRGCCWNPSMKRPFTERDSPLNEPYCYYPKDWSLYKYENFSAEGNDFSGFLTQTKNSFYEKDLPLVKVEATTVDASILRVKMYDPVKKRYEPPWPVRADPKPFLRKNVDAKYKVEMDKDKPGFKVYRKSDATTIFDCTDVGGFIFSDQFLQISGLLPTHNIYGIGEHQTSLKLSTQWQIFTLFNKDQPPVENVNLYGSHPFYLIMENSGKSHGVLFLNSNAMDVILQPSPGITFRTIGGIFDIYFFLGPSPADVIRQYSNIVGKPFLPPYWSLGFHLCRFGYGSLKNTKEVWNRTIAAGIPFDTQWNDLDYMDKNNDFTYNLNSFKDLPGFVDEIHAKGMHYIPLIDAGVSGSDTDGTYLPYDEGVKQGIFVKNPANDQPFVGKVWNLVSTVWPDHTNPKTRNYYHRMMSNMYDSFAYDGAWIDMNEPSNFYNGYKNGCPQSEFDYPKYVPNVPGGLLATKTLCMTAKHYAGIHYDLHNVYGISHMVSTNYALTRIRKRRPFIISRSTWVGSGYYGGHWTGDVFSTWHDMKMSVPAMLSMNFYQIPMVGADICGFNGNTTAALCNRWMQLGAFYPFSRNHNSDDTIEQDPVAMGDLVVRSSRAALTIRYWLLPYLYTLFFRAHTFGDTVARPLFFEFANDSATYDVDTQFLWGKSLMIIPVLEERATAVRAYIPRGLWYNLYTKKSFFAMGKYYTINAPLDVIPLMIRGGSILPAQQPANTTTGSRKNNFKLLVALDEAKRAKGELYWDDGDSLDSFEKGQFVWSSFAAKDNTLTNSQMKHGSFDEKVLLDEVLIWGVTSKVSRVALNGTETPFEYSDKENCLTVNKLRVDLRETFSLSWEYAEA